VELITSRLHLRPFTAADHEAIHAVYSDPDVMRYVGHGAHRSMAETVRALRVYADILAAHGYSFLAVVERDGGALVGDAGLNPLGGRGPDVELGYTVAHEAWGRGYATEVGRALVEHAFGTLGVPRVVAQVEPDNAASRHVLEKLGMTPREERVAYGRPHLLYAIERPGVSAYAPEASRERSAALPMRRPPPDPRRLYGFDSNRFRRRMRGPVRVRLA
jgi:RimJ/RimL family protein N-acetyltransferase